MVSPTSTDQLTPNNFASSVNDNQRGPQKTHVGFNEREATLMRNYVENMALWVRKFKILFLPQISAEYTDVTYDRLILQTVSGILRLKPPYERSRTLFYAFPYLLSPPGI